MPSYSGEPSLASKTITLRVSPRYLSTLNAGLHKQTVFESPSALAELALEVGLETLSRINFQFVRAVVASRK